MGLQDLIKNIHDMKFTEIKGIIDTYDIRIHSNDEIEELFSAMREDQRTNVQNLSEKLSRSLDKFSKEVDRVRGLYDFDRSFGDYKYIAGVDEVGRGPLAGPIVAAAVILDLNKLNTSDLILGINDSKKLSAKQRKELSFIIKEKAISYKIVEISNEEIDSRGIAHCNNKAFQDSCMTLDMRPDLVLSDGYPIKDFKLPNKFVIKGDTKSASIACASIIAKVYRDELMERLSLTYPHYGFENNAGYGTQQHIDGIRAHGTCPIHRMSFLRSILD